MHKIRPMGHRLCDGRARDPADDTTEQIPVSGAPRRLQVRVTLINASTIWIFIKGPVV